jgi:uncharacterized membrane protein YgdD (TMEM256/DUF423 family)
MSWIKIAALLGFLGVALGAFGAHGLKGKVSESLLSAYQTGVLYHLLHAVALFSLALSARSIGRDITIPAAAFVAGIVLFSGSLYAMALTGITRFGVITPLGGLAFLAGWAAVLVKL